MGLILDSSVLITAERQGQNARQMLSAISAKAGNTDIAVSVVTLIELAHGAARADTALRNKKRPRPDIVGMWALGVGYHTGAVASQF